MLSRAICLSILLVYTSTRITAADSNSSQSAGDAPVGQADYILQPYDLIEVVVFQEPDLEREVRLSQDTTIQLPLIGTVDLNDRTVREAEALVRKRYLEYLVSPQINITVKEYARETVNVLGAVNSPGAITIPPEQPLKLLDAITRAGGFSRLADRNKVKLTRLNGNGKTSTYVINADDIIQSKSAEPWILSKGDVIYVPERIL
jgi:polysaccharide biosynthesis/export protein